MPNKVPGGGGGWGGSMGSSSGGSFSSGVPKGTGVRSPSQPLRLTGRGKAVAGGAAGALAENLRQRSMDNAQANSLREMKRLEEFNKTAEHSSGVTLADHDLSLYESRQALRRYLRHQRGQDK